MSLLKRTVKRACGDLKSDLIGLACCLVFGLLCLAVLFAATVALDSVSDVFSGAAIIISGVLGFGGNYLLLNVMFEFFEGSDNE